MSKQIPYTHPNTSLTHIRYTHPHTHIPNCTTHSLVPLEQITFNTVTYRELFYLMTTGWNIHTSQHIPNCTAHSVVPLEQISFDMKSSTQNMQTKELISAQKMWHKQQQRLKPPMPTLTWHARKFKVQKLHQKYILRKGCHPGACCTCMYPP